MLKVSLAVNIGFSFSAILLFVNKKASGFLYFFIFLKRDIALLNLFFAESLVVYIKSCFLRRE
jgi:hypothetical protein